MPINANDANRPDYVRAEALDAAEDLVLIHDLLDGPRAMWDGARDKGYIPKWTDEAEQVYQLRATCEPVEDLFGRTLSACVGKVFAKPPVLEFGAQEDAIRAQWDNINGRGTKGDVAAKEFAADAIADGFACILVDHAPAPARISGVTVTGANERALNVRPFWAFYPRAALLSWATATVNNVEVVVQAVFAESREERAGPFGTTQVQFFRELVVEDGVAQWRLWRSPVTEGGAFTVEQAGVFRNRTGQTRDTLPLTTGYTGRRTAWFVAAPPLRGVAYANLAHWRLATELTFGRRVSAIEQPVVRGKILGPDGTEGTLAIGWLKGVQVEAEGGFEWVGPSGTGLDQLKQGKVEKEQAVAMMGMSFMARDTRAAETAEAKRLDAAAEDSTLATAAQGLEDALNEAAAFHCWYLGLAPAEAFTLRLNRDFTAAVLLPAQVQALAKLVETGLPVRKAVEALVAGGVLTATPEEIDEIARDWEAGLVAKDDAQALQDEMALQDAEARRAA